MNKGKERGRRRREEEGREKSASEKVGGEFFTFDLFGESRCLRLGGGGYLSA